MSTKRTGLVVVLAALALGAPRVPAHAQSTLNVASTSKQIVDNLPFYVAQNTDILKKHDLVLQLTHFSGGGAVVRAVATGSADLGMVATSAAIVAIGRAEPLKVVSAWTAPAYGIVWIVPANSAVKSVKDLAGQKVGISRPASVSHTGLVAALKANGIADKVQIVPVGSPGDSWAAVSSGRVQATWHTAPAVYSLTDAGKASILFKISDYLTHYQQGALIATTASMKSKAATIKKFLSAMAEADHYIEGHPAQAAAIFAKVTGVSQAAAQKVIADAPHGFFKIGAPTKENIAGSMAEAMATGSLKKEPSYADVIDTSLLP